MIVNFSVQNYLCIKNKVKLSFEATASKDLEEYYVSKKLSGKLRLLKIGLIYGANASGKTTVLNALDFLRQMVNDPFTKKTDVFDFEPYLFDSKTRAGNTFFSLEFIQNEVKYLYEVELNKSAIVSEKLFFYNPRKALVFSRTTDMAKQLTIINEIGSKISLSNEHKSALEANTLWNNSVLGGYLKTNIESFELQEVSDWFKTKLKPLIEPRTDLLAYVSSKIENKEIDTNNVVQILKKADFNISGISIEKKELVNSPELLNLLIEKLKLSENKKTEIKEKGVLESKEVLFHHTIENGSTVVLPYRVESAGTQRYYQFSGLLDMMIRNDVIFPIDELESSLHPDLFKYFILTFLVNSKHSQIIATTHHREFLMEKDILRNDSIWFTDKNDAGCVDLYSLSDFDSSVIRNTTSIYNAYKIGKLGARPNLNDYFINIEDGKE